MACRRFETAVEKTAEATRLRRAADITTERRRMSQAEQATQTPDPIYNLVSVLYHALEGGQVYDQYIRDAEREGDDELAQFFRDVQREDQQRSERAQGLLHRKIG